MTNNWTLQTSKTDGREFYQDAGKLHMIDVVDGGFDVVVKNWQAVREPVVFATLSEAQNFCEGDIKMEADNA